MYLIYKMFTLKELFSAVIFYIYKLKSDKYSYLEIELKGFVERIRIESLWMGEEETHFESGNPITLEFPFKEKIITKKDEKLIFRRTTTIEEDLKYTFEINKDKLNFYNPLRNTYNLQKTKNTLIFISEDFKYSYINQFKLKSYKIPYKTFFLHLKKSKNVLLKENADIKQIRVLSFRDAEPLVYFLTASVLILILSVSVMILYLLVSMTPKTPLITPNELNECLLVKYKDIEHEKIRMRKFEECLICLMRFGDEEECRVLFCKHFYHKQCIDPWLNGSSSRCPYCREVIKFSYGDEESD